MKTVIRNFIAWLFAFVLEELKKHTVELRTDVEYYLRTLREDFEKTVAQRRPKAYVTVRGVIWKGNESFRHGWTQSVQIGEGDETALPFYPFARFDVEQVDVLGPASIVDVQVGNFAVVNTPFDAPATVAVRETCPPGSRILVRLKGLP